ncbi:MAG: hypothetical protein Q8M19_09710 [Reyranella sp.]|nr:hypothetical protein [Reyranella sp.]
MHGSSNRIPVGAYRHIFDHIPADAADGHALLKRFLSAARASDISHTEGARAAAELLDWVGAQKWDSKIAAKFETEVAQQFLSGRYARAVINPQLANLVKAVEKLDPRAADEAWRRLEAHLWRLGSSGDHVAFRAFMRLHDSLGPGDPGWKRVVERLQKNPEKIAEEGKKLRDAMRRLEDMAESPERTALLDTVKSARGIQSSIKGMLCEIYAARWPPLQRAVKESLDDARTVAHNLGGNWEALHVVGDIKINGKDAYDQAVILVNWHDNSVIVHTAVQIKAERGKLSVFEQLGNDIRRERVDVSKLPAAMNEAASGRVTGPVGSFAIDGRTEAFKLVLPLDGMETQRYVAFAEGATLGRAEAKELADLGVEVMAMPVDLSMNSLDALAIQVMIGAAK